jgi:hypothetical protein
MDASLRLFQRLSFKSDFQYEVNRQNQIYSPIRDLSTIYVPPYICVRACGTFSSPSLSNERPIILIRSASASPPSLPQCLQRKSPSSLHTVGIGTGVGRGRTKSDERSNYADACERDRAELESIGSLQDRINVPRLTEGGRKEGLVGHVEG